MYDSAYILVVVLHVKLPAKKLVYIYICDNRDYQLRLGILIISAIYVTNHNNNYHIFYIDRVIIYNYLIRFGIRCTRI